MAKVKVLAALLLALLLAALLAASLVACGDEAGGDGMDLGEAEYSDVVGDEPVDVAAFADGVYVGRSGSDALGAYGEVTITIQGGRVADCQYVTWQPDGTAKGEDYGKIGGVIANQDFYDKAQAVVAAMTEYAERFAATSDLAQVDTVSGATFTYNQFKEAVHDAL